MATRQTLQLEELSYEYELFRENQLLTHEQLNKFIRYFEDQDRLTRTCLIGVGLVCGLSAKIKNNVLTISQGCAVTTDGDLLKMETTDYKFFKAYSNLTRGKGDPIYDPFFPPASGGTQVKLWELMVTDKVETGNKPDSLAAFKTITGSDVDDMVALLYLEYYLSEPDDCTAIDCDHLGQLQNAKIKALLISQQDMDKVINSEPTEIIADHIYKSYYEAYEKYFELPELKAKRLPMTSLNTASLGALTKGYTNIITNGTAALLDAIEDLYNTFQFILDPTKYFKILTIKNKLNATLTSAVKPFQVQYQYDFYKDIIDGYNEIKDTIYNAIYICCPDKYAFPKHIMLGIVNADLGPKPPRYRHYFYPSPAVSKNKSYLSVAKSMFNRLVDMSNGFTLPAQPTAVRITPSMDPDKQMEWRAIPFYYKNAADLRSRWSYYRTMRGTDKNILSYHGLEYGENDSTKNPLDYDLDKNNFFRIEGHQGKKMNEAMEAILDIRNTKSLPFDVVAVRMDENQKMEIDLDDFTCQFDDLNAVLNAWIVEQDCLYAKTVKFFSSFDNTGKNRQPVKTGGVKFVRETDNARNLVRAPQMKKEAPQYMKSNEAASGKSNISSGYASGMKSNYTYPQSKTYQVDDTVNQNLFLEEDTIGFTYQELTRANNFMLADAYIGLFLQFADQNPKLQLLTADQREIVYNIPVKLISRINEVTRFKPFEIKDLNGDVLTDYQNAIEALCDEAEASRIKAENIFAKAIWVKQGYEQQYLNALVELTENCCAADKLKTLIEEIEARKRDILESLSFANYAARHAGLEHRAGVVKGGTFVILYASVVTKGIPGKSGGASLSAGNDSKSRLAKTQQRDITDFFEEDEDTFLLELVNRKEELDVPETIKEYLGTKGYSMSTLKGKVKLNAMLSRADVFAAQLAADLKDTVSNEMVVADFCLPYLCCSDCPPMVFVMPKQKYSLALPKAVACSDETSLLFQKDPMDGEVVASAGFEATVIEKEGQTFFDPTQVNAADFGKEIKFTIDGQVTDCVIKVLKHPTSKFSYKITDENADVMVVQFTNESDDATGTQYEYEWNFADGRPVQKVKTKDPITVTYKKEIFATGAKSFKVTLKANNGGCTHTSEQTIPITAIPVNVDLIPEKTKACENDAPVGLTVVPADGKVKCKEVPFAILIKDGKLTFDPLAIPAALRDTPIHFTVNDKDVPATITVFAMPDASFSIDNDNAVRKGDLLSFDIILKNRNADEYALEYPGGIISKDMKPDAKGLFHVTDLDIKGISGKTTLTLRAHKKDSPCGIAVETETLIIPDAPERDCNALVANFLSSGMAALEAQHSSLKNQDLISLNRYYIDDVFKKAIDSVDKLNEPSVQSTLYMIIKERLGNILGLKLEDATEQRQATLILRQVLMISMNIIRCDDEIETDIEERHNDIMKAFMDAVLKNSLAKNFSTLDERDILTAFIKKFLEDYKPGGSVADMLNEVMNVLGAEF
jgi:hypothetical protein